MNNLQEEVKVSSKYQVVIPKSARKKLGLTEKTGYTLRVKKVSSTEITLEKLPDWRDFIGTLPTPSDSAVDTIRKQRDTEWE